MNRVTEKIAKVKEQIAAKLAAGQVTQQVVDETHKALDMPMDEYVLFQEMKSLASTNGQLTLEEAMTVYGYLGEVPDTFNNQPIEVKVVLTQLFQELLDRRVKKLRG